MNVAELLLPALRWDAQRGYESQRAIVDQGLDLGVGGFVLFGGPAAEVSALTAELRERSRIPLLIATDLERGAGQQFPEMTGLPPLAALGALDDVEIMRGAASLTAREASALGINWVYAPVLDIDVEPDNPIIGTRAIGPDPASVAKLGAAWIEACQAEGVLACAKHFPGHGRTTTDSHAELPVVAAEADVLEREDLHPFRTAIRAGVASVMTAHVAFPAFDPSGQPATLSRPILHGLLRDRLGFDGLIVSDALIMAGVRQDDPEPRAAARALAAGCDLLLYPEDVEGVIAEMRSAVGRGEIDEGEVALSAQRRRRWADWADAAHGAAPDGAASEWGAAVACSVVRQVQGDAAPLSGGGAVRVTVVDDDIGGPFPPPSREPFVERLRELGLRVTDAENGRATHIVALFGDIRAWKGRPGYSERALEEVRRAVGAGAEGGGSTVLLQFSHPRLAQMTGVDVPIVSAWGGEPVMQRAAAEWLVRRCHR